MLLDHLGIHDAGHAGGQAGKENTAGIFFIQGYLHRVLVDGTHRVRRNAELRQDERRLIFEDNHPLKRVNDIVGRQGVAAVKFYTLA